MQITLQNTSQLMSIARYSIKTAQRTNINKYVRINTAKLRNSFGSMFQVRETIDKKTENTRGASRAECTRNVIQTYVRFITTSVLIYYFYTYIYVQVSRLCVPNTTKIRFLLRQLYGGHQKKVLNVEMIILLSQLWAKGPLQMFHKTCVLKNFPKKHSKTSWSLLLIVLRPTAL